MPPGPVLMPVRRGETRRRPKPLRKGLSQGERPKYAEEVMTMIRKTRSAVGLPGRRAYSTWWLLAKDGKPWAEVLTVNNDGERTLPAFSGEGEAEMFLWFGGAFKHGWHVRETSAGELVSLLLGPYAGVRSVA